MMNAILAAAAMNFKRAMNLWHTEALSSWQLIGNLLTFVYRTLMLKKLKMTF